MNIKHTLESLSIQTSDDKLFCELSDLINKNFKKNISTKGKVISFYEENEIPQRKYFLKFIKRIYDRENKEQLNINFAEYKTIKLQYVKENTLSKVIQANLFFQKDEVVFRINRSENIFFGYILQSFKDNEFKINQNNTRLNLKIKSEKDFENLKTLFDKKEHMNFIVNFKFDEYEFEKFKREYKVQNSSKFINRFSALANLLEDNFKALNCNTKSTLCEVRESYLDLVKIYHPDRHSNKSDNIKNVYREKFEQIQQAYESLKAFFKSQEEFVSA